MNTYNPQHFIDPSFAQIQLIQCASCKLLLNPTIPSHTKCNDGTSGDDYVICSNCGKCKPPDVDGGVVSSGDYGVNKRQPLECICCGQSFISYQSFYAHLPTCKIHYDFKEQSFKQIKTLQTQLKLETRKSTGCINTIKNLKLNYKKLQTDYNALLLDISGIESQLTICNQTVDELNLKLSNIQSIPCTSYSITALDKSTNFPITNYDVSINKKVIATGVSGTYQISAKSGDVVRVESVGYFDETYTLSIATNVTVRLSPAPVNYAITVVDDTTGSDISNYSVQLNGTSVLTNVSGTRQVRGLVGDVLTVSAVGYSSGTHTLNPANPNITVRLVRTRSSTTCKPTLASNVWPNPNVPTDVADRICRADGTEKRPVGETRQYWYNGAFQIQFLSHYWGSGVDIYYSPITNTPYTGEFKWWGNGQLERHVFYKDGKAEGEHKWWYGNGKPMQHVLYKDGKLDGESKSWHHTGLQSHDFYKDGAFVKGCIKCRGKKQTDGNCDIQPGIRY